MKIYQLSQIANTIIDCATEPAEVFARWRSSVGSNSKHVFVRESLLDSQIALLTSRAEVPIDDAFARSKLCEGVDCRQLTQKPFMESDEPVIVEIERAFLMVST